jgi:hypothetical protein
VIWHGPRIIYYEAESDDQAGCRKAIIANYQAVSRSLGDVITTIDSCGGIDSLTSSVADAGL